jgi:hypothetical protein
MTRDRRDVYRMVAIHAATLEKKDKNTRFVKQSIMLARRTL